MFAGGAVIAEQLVLWADLVQWISADPVTGSSVRISKNGAFHDIDRKELEPLGQEVLPQEPPAQQPPPSAENAKFSAQEPEWQYQAAEARFGKSFFDQPVHCQKAALQNIGLKELFAEETNPKRIAPAGGSPEASGQTAGDRPANLTATDKPHSSGGGAAGSPASIPSADGDTDGCDWASGSLKCAVQSERWMDSEIPGFVGADVGGITDLFNIITEGATNYVNIKDTQSARVLLKNVLSEDCKNAIADLISALEKVTGKRAITYDILALFDEIATHQKKGGFRFDSRTSAELKDQVRKDYKSVKGINPDLSPYPALGYTFRAPVSWKNTKSLKGDFEAYVYVRGSQYVNNAPWKNAKQVAPVIITTLIHEIIHVAHYPTVESGNVAPVYLEEDFDKAAKRIGVKSFDSHISENCNIK